MAKRKIKVELESAKGNKYTVALEGNLSDQNIAKILNMVQLLNTDDNKEGEAPLVDTAFSKIHGLIEDKFPFGEFSSADVLEAYEDAFNTTIGPSTISTYLSRLAERQLLERHRRGLNWMYRRAKPKHLV